MCLYKLDCVAAASLLQTLQYCQYFHSQLSRTSHSSLCHHLSGWSPHCLRSHVTQKKTTAEQGSRSKVVTRVVSGVLFAQTCLFCDVTRNINLDNQSCHTGTDHIPVSVLVSYQYFYSKAFVPHLLLSHDYRKGSKISLLTKMVK